MSSGTTLPRAAEAGGDAHLFIVSCPRVIHSAGRPITYLFVVNASCPDEARRHENWGLVERVTTSDTEIVRGGPGVARAEWLSPTPGREWRISVGNANGVIFQERFLERDDTEERLKDILGRIPRSALLVEECLVGPLVRACGDARVSFRVKDNPFPLCADCVEFGCNGCEKKTRGQDEDLEGKTFHLV